ncbi:MAG: 2-oxoisovalerate dehydrogenase component [Thermoleophilaceae bacterium]|nr:2-oxoisovalerate dehydrogenase component [Thermoleophilaceae bacterium]
MWVIRIFEERVAALAKGRQLPGTVHTSIGQEAVAVGACAGLRDSDLIVSTHRGHGHCIAKGMHVDRAMAELFGKATGACKGKGGSMHIADPSIGILGANGIVGAGLPIAAGAAMARQLAGKEDVVLAFFGEGATSTGAFHEALNLATLWSLPVIFLCENNGFVEFLPATELTRAPDVIAPAQAQGVAAIRVDGNDVETVRDAVAHAAAQCRAGSGPWLIEAVTSRWAGHYEGDPRAFGLKESLPAERLRDPLETQYERLSSLDPDAASIREEIIAEARQLVAQAEERARAADYPDPSEAFTDVYADGFGPAAL